MKTLTALLFAGLLFSTGGTAIVCAQEAAVTAPAASIKESDRQFLARMESGNPVSHTQTIEAKPKTPAESLNVKTVTVEKKQKPKPVTVKAKARKPEPPAFRFESAKKQEVATRVPFRVVRITTTTVTTKVNPDDDDDDDEED